MFEAFMEDNSPFKKRLMLTVLLSVVSIGSTFFLSQMYTTKVNENNHLLAEYSAQSDWFRQFDYKDATKLYNMVLKPCKQNQIDTVQAEQLAILKDHNLSILSVKNEAPLEKPDKKIPLKYRKSTVSVSGSWNDIVSAINEFEKKNLVVITNANLSLNENKNAETQGLMKVTLEYNIYFA